MPRKIQEYVPQELPVNPEAIAGRRAQASDFGFTTNIGEQIGDALSDLGGVLLKREREKERFEVAKAVADETTGLMPWYAEAEKTAGPGAPDFAKTIQAGLGSRRDALRERFKGYSDEAKMQLELDLPRVYDRYIGAAIEYQSKQHGAQVKLDLTGRLGALQNTVTQDPGFLPQAIETGQMLIQSTPDVDGTTKAAMQQGMELDFYRSALEGEEAAAVNSKDPTQIQGVLQSMERYTDKVSPEVFQRTKEHLDKALIDTRGDVAQEYVNGKFKGAISAWLHGSDAYDGTWPVTFDDVKAEVEALDLPQARRQMLLRDAEAARDVKEVYQAMERGPEGYNLAGKELEDIRARRGQVFEDQTLVASTIKTINDALEKAFGVKVDIAVKALKEGNVPPENAEEIWAAITAVFPEETVKNSPKVEEIRDVVLQSERNQLLDRADYPTLLKYKAEIQQQREAVEVGGFSFQADRRYSADSFRALTEAGIVQPSSKKKYDGSLILNTYAYPGDTGDGENPLDDNSAAGIGLRGVRRLGSTSLAISPELRDEFKLKEGDPVYLVTEDGKEHFLGTYDDHSPYKGKLIEAYDPEGRLGQFQGLIAAGKWSLRADRRMPLERMMDLKAAEQDVDARAKEMGSYFYDRLKQRVTALEEEGNLPGLAQEAGDLELAAEALGKYGAEAEKLANTKKAIFTAEENVKKEYSADPAKYLLRAEPVNQAWNQYIALRDPEQTAKMDPKALAQARSQTFAKYTESLEKAATARGLPAGFIYRNPLPKEYINSLALQFDSTEPGAPKAAVETMMSMAGEMGPKWFPQVARQMHAEKAMPGWRFFYALNPSASIQYIAQDLERYGHEDFSVLRSRVIGAETDKPISEAEIDRIAGEVASPFLQTLALSPASGEIARAVTEGLKVGGVGRAAMTNSDLRQSMQAYFQKVILDQYDLPFMRNGNENYRHLRVPRVAAIGTVYEGMEGVVRDLRPEQLGITDELMQSMEGLFQGKQKEYFGSIKTKHYWLLNGDETGVFLYDGGVMGIGNPVFGADGKPLEYSFKELRLKGMQEIERRKRDAMETKAALPTIGG